MESGKAGLGGSKYVFCCAGFAEMGGCLSAEQLTVLGHALLLNFLLVQF